MRRLIFCLFFSYFFTMQAQFIRFQSLDEILRYAESHSSTLKNATQQALLAKYQTMAAKLSKWNLQGSVTFLPTINTKLPVNFIPAEIFGGPAGSYREIAFGQKYVSNLTLAPQIDSLNPYAAARVDVSKANEQLTLVNNLLGKKSLYESIAGAYYNSLSDFWQITVTTQILIVADSLSRIIQDKEKEGVARPQDVDNAKANWLSVQDKLQQLEVQLEQQKDAIKLLCDIDQATILNIDMNKPAPPFNPLLAASGRLDVQQTEWLERYQQADLRSNKTWFLPIVTAMGNIGWQQNTNNNFFDNSRWFATNYVGLRITVPFLPDAGKIAAVKSDRINIRMAETNRLHAILQDSINNSQLLLDYEKSYRSYQISIRIELLKQDAYYKNLNIYEEGLLSATDLLNSFNDWLNNSLISVSQLATSEYNKIRIEINNSLK